jgi:hypothetical protein
MMSHPRRQEEEEEKIVAITKIVLNLMNQNYH